MVRAIFILVLAASAYVLHPFGLTREMAAVGGLILGGCIIFFEIRLERVSLKRLIGAAAGSVLGIFGAFLMSLVLGEANAPRTDFKKLVTIIRQGGYRGYLPIETLAMGRKNYDPFVEVARVLAEMRAVIAATAPV